MWIETDKGSAGAALTVTRAAKSDAWHRIYHVAVSYDSSATGALMEVKSGSTVIYQLYIHNSRVLDFDPPLSAKNENEAVSVTVAAVTGATAATSMVGETF